jgi:glycosyltransferase involved in cell wall biosynthesis
MISVVVPIYNEEELIVRFHEAVSNALDGIAEDWEVVYVNDGSRDSSLEILKNLQAEDPHVVVVELSRNWGHMGAIAAGLQTSRGDATIIMDGDFQDPPHVLPELVEAWRAGAEVVVAVRRSRQESRKVLAKLFPLFYRLLGALSDFPIPLDAGIFGLLNRKAVDSINSLRERNRYLPGLRAWVGYRNAIVYYDRQDRAAGDGKLSFVSRIKYAMDAITSFSYKPLRLAFPWPDCPPAWRCCWPYPPCFPATLSIRLALGWRQQSSLLEACCLSAWECSVSTSDVSMMRYGRARFRSSAGSTQRPILCPSRAAARTRRWSQQRSSGRTSLRNAIRKTSVA